MEIIEEINLLMKKYMKDNNIDILALQSNLHAQHGDSAQSVLPKCSQVPHVIIVNERNNW